MRHSPKRHPIAYLLLTSIVFVLAQLVFAGRAPEWNPIEINQRAIPQQEPGMPAARGQDTAWMDTVHASQLHSDTFFSTESGQRTDETGNTKPAAKAFEGRKTNRWVILGLVLGALLGLGWLGYRASEPQVPEKKRRGLRQRKERPGRRNMDGNWIGIVLGILILMATFWAGLLLTNLLLGTVFTGFGMASLGIGLPLLLIAVILFIITETVIKDLVRVPSHLRGPVRGFAKMASGCLLVLIVIYIILPATLLAGVLLTWGSLAIFVGGVGFGMSALIFIIMLALIVMGSLVADWFFDW